MTNLDGKDDRVERLFDALADRLASGGTDVAAADAAVARALGREYASRLRPGPAGESGGVAGSDPPAAMTVGAEASDDA